MNCPLLTLQYHHQVSELHLELARVDIMFLFHSIPLPTLECHHQVTELHSL